MNYYNRADAECQVTPAPDFYDHKLEGYLFMQDYRHSYKGGKYYSPAATPKPKREPLYQVIGLGALMGGLITLLCWYGLMQATGGFQ